MDILQFASACIVLILTGFAFGLLWYICSERKRINNQADAYLSDVEKCLKRNKSLESYFRKRLFIPEDMTIEEYLTRAHVLSIQDWMQVFNRQFGVASEFSLKLARNTTMKIPLERYPRMKLRSGKEI